MQKRRKVINYYFLNRYLHPKPPKGFRETVVVLITLKSDSDQKNKFLIIKEKFMSWGLPKKGLKGNNLVDGIINALVEDMGNEIGFKGPILFQLKPQFVQKAYFLNFTKQIYDKQRSIIEKNKGRPSRGKIYHLAMIDYYGKAELPLKKSDKDAHIIDYKWASQKEGEQLILENKNLIEKEGKLFSAQTAIFGLDLFRKVMRAYKLVQEIYKMSGGNLDKESDQVRMIGA